MPDTALTPFALASGWQPALDFNGGPFMQCGYYVHNDTGYLAGVIGNNNGQGYNYQPISAPTLITDLPSDVRPANPVHISIPVRVALDSMPGPLRLPGVDHPMLLAATVGTDGSLTLDGGLPPWINTPPDPSVWWHIYGNGNPTVEPDYFGPLPYLLVLDAVRWSLGGPSDTYTSDALAPYLNTDAFEDVDSLIAVHGSRVHLGGRVRARVNCYSLKANASNGRLAVIPADYVRAIGGPGGSFPYMGRAETAPHTSRGARPTIEVARFSRDGLADVNLSADNPSPIDGPTLQWLRDNFDNILWPDRMATPVAGVRSYPSQGNEGGAYIPWGTLQTSYSAENPAEGRHTFSWENSTYICEGGFPFGSSTCRSLGPSGSGEVRLDGMLAHYSPQPDWVAIVGSVGDPGGGGTIIQLANDGTCTSGLSGPTSACGPHLPPPNMIIDCLEFGGQFIAANHPTDANGTTYTDGDEMGATVTLAPTWDSADDAGNATYPRYNLWLERPVAGGYDKDPYNKASRLLWRPEEIIGKHISCRFDGGSWAGNVAMGFSMICLYETTSDWILAGDIIDLTGCGWFAPAPAPPAPPLVGDIATGAPVTGIVSG